jgi:hypothetical protein
MSTILFVIWVLTIMSLLGYKKSEDTLIKALGIGMICTIILIPIVLVLFICGIV